MNKSLVCYDVFTAKIYDTFFRGNTLNLLKPTGHVMHQQFNIQLLYVLPTQCIYVFCIYLRTNGDLCHLQHKLIGFITDMRRVYCAV